MPGYRIATESLAEIQGRYDQLVDAVERYHRRIAAEPARAEASPGIPEHYPSRVAMHMASSKELLDVLETAAHDALVRASDRTILIKVAAEGTFV